MKYAKPEWRDGQPYSAEFDDVYFSVDNGLEETRYVFIKNNHLLERFVSSDTEKRQFVIAETGFGSGLNFLVAVKHWLDLSNPADCLYFYSVESTPFTLEDLILAHQAWPELKNIAEALQQQYQVASYGFHLFELFDGRVKLILMIGDVKDMLAQMQVPVDAWFLDGFAPSLNAGMWSSGVLDQIQRLSRQGTTFSTYTAVGDVRRGLMQVGFTVSKVSGCGKKRHMLAGVFELAAQPSALTQPWYEGVQSSPGGAKSVCIIGAGITGLTTAWALVKRGYEVEIIEQGEQFGAQASGNPQAMLMPRLSLQHTADAEFYTSSYFYALRCLQQLDSQQTSWQQTGAMQLPSSARIRKQIAEYPQTSALAKVLDAQAASELAGIEINERVHYYPLAISLQPMKVLQSLIDDMGSALRIRYQTHIDSFVYSDNQWHLFNKKSAFIKQADILICASAWQTNHFDSLKHLGVQAVRGQISVFNTTPKSRKINMPLSYDGYLLPALNNEQVAGASFVPGDISTEISEAEHQANLEDMQQWFSDLFSTDDIRGGRASIRAVTSDRMPVLGAAPDEVSYVEEYVDLHKGKPAHRYTEGSYLPGLYVNTGHGARGFTTAFLAAELLAATICGEPLPVANRVRYALHPARFLIRSFKKKQ
jgi:tRNA 5-methylaminomethyl-2-thiouridine biosynthesis bifunctional protein